MFQTTRIHRPLRMLAQEIIAARGSRTVSTVIILSRCRGRLSIKSPHALSSLKSSMRYRTSPDSLIIGDGISNPTFAVLLELATDLLEKINKGIQSPKYRKVSKPNLYFFFFCSFSFSLSSSAAVSQIGNNSSAPIFFSGANYNTDGSDHHQRA